jgi:hypothetical protein
LEQCLKARLRRYFRTGLRKPRHHCTAAFNVLPLLCIREVEHEMRGNSREPPDFTLFKHVIA